MGDFVSDLLGGGGGGSAPAPTQQATTATELPEWARGYAKDVLAKGAALTDVNQNPYQAYTGERIAGFSPLQLRAQQEAAGMQTNAATGQGIGLAGQAAQRALGTGYQGGSFYGGQFSPMAAAQYMSPFIEQSLQPQLREAQRSSDIMGQQNAARAVGQGAFGGSRAALVEAERQRNLGMQMGDIRAKGLQDAYSQAQSQFNADMGRSLQAQQLGEQSRQYGAGLGLQGLQTALTGANTLGALGGQQFQQGMDINKLLSAYGGQQQALQQQGLTQAYNDFLNQQNYPYKQLGFMSDLIRGLPVGQTSTKSVYEAEPSAAQNIASLGMGAYGLSKFMAEGGMAYADGGSVDAPDNVQRIVSKLSDQQLQQAAQAAQARGDMDQLEAIQSEMAMRASERRGLAGAVTNEMADRFAGGGILAFAGDEDENDPVGGQLVTGVPNQAALKEWMAAQKAIAEFEPSPAYTEADRAKMDKANFERFQKFAGEDPYAPMLEKSKGFASDLEAQRERGKGAIALQMSRAILRPGSKARAFGEAAGVMGEGLSALDAAQNREKRALASMEFNIKDAQRKERMGLTKEAINATADAQKDKIAVDKARLDALKARAKGATDAGRAFRTTGGAGGAGKTPKIAEQNYINILADLRATSKPKEGESPQAFEARIAREASKIAVAESKTSDFGPGRAGAAADAIAVKLKAAETDALEKLSRNPDYREATPAMKQSMEDKVRADAQRRVYFEESQGAAANPGAGKNSSGSGKLKFDSQGNQI